MCTGLGIEKQAGTAAEETTLDTAPGRPDVTVEELRENLLRWDFVTAAWRPTQALSAEPGDVALCDLSK